MYLNVTIETILTVIIIAVTLNLLLIGFYIINVLREVKNTIRKAGAVIDDVDQSVKDGIEKLTAMEKPMQAIATTAAAFGGIIKGSSLIRKATQSILASVSDSGSNSDSDKPKRRKFLTRPKFFKKSKPKEK